jgi:hypothetical protein
MKTLETLHLRMAGADVDDLIEVIRKATGPSGAGPDLSVFSHSAIQGDFLVQLPRKGPDHADQPSDLGLRLASMLRAHGLVEHSVWVQREQPRE